MSDTSSGNVRAYEIEHGGDVSYTKRQMMQAEGVVAVELVSRDEHEESAVFRVTHEASVSGRRVLESIREQDVIL